MEFCLTSSGGPHLCSVKNIVGIRAGAPFDSGRVVLLHNCIVSFFFFIPPVWGEVLPNEFEVWEEDPAGGPYLCSIADIISRLACSRCPFGSGEGHGPLLTEFSFFLMYCHFTAPKREELAAWFGLGSSLLNLNFCCVFQVDWMNVFCWTCSLVLEGQVDPVVIHTCIP